MQSGSLRLSHGWKLAPSPGLSQRLIGEFIRPAIRAMPSSMARRLGPCQISFQAEAEAGVASRWTMSGSSLSVQVATAGVEEHDVAMELLVCLGQILWEKLSAAESHEYWNLLRDEIGLETEGEIDENALEEKRALLGSRSHATGVKRLARYALLSFAGTAAEYVHCLWHEVTVRDGPDYLPVPQLRRRLLLLARWFPPDRGYRLFPAKPRRPA